MSCVFPLALSSGRALLQLIDLLFYLSELGLKRANFSGGGPSPLVSMLLCPLELFRQVILLGIIFFKRLFGCLAEVVDFNRGLCMIFLRFLKLVFCLLQLGDMTNFKFLIWAFRGMP